MKVNAAAQAFVIAVFVLTVALAMGGLGWWYFTGAARYPIAGEWFVASFVALAAGLSVVLYTDIVGDKQAALEQGRAGARLGQGVSH